MPASQETTEVREAHRIDERALARYLETVIPGFRGPLRVRQFEGGQSNPTYLLHAPSMDLVLRKKPPGQLLPTAHMIEREYRVISALAETDVPVARTHVLCEDPTVIGTAFFLMDFVEGRVFWEPTLPRLGPEERQAIYAEMARVLAALHSVDYSAVGLSDYGKPGNYFARQINRWTKQYIAARTEAFDAMDRLIEWLPANIPADDSTAIVHGDFRMDNMIFHASEPRVLAVLDWELSTLGHPMADLAYNCMPYYFAKLGSSKLDRAGGGGIPSEQAYIAAYCQRRGLEGVTHWPFYLAFSMFRLASITQGVYHRGLRGNASSAHALSAIETARASGRMGWSIAAGET